MGDVAGDGECAWETCVAVRLGDKVLGAQNSEMDLGVIMQNDLKVDISSVVRLQMRRIKGWA